MKYLTRLERIYLGVWKKAGEGTSEVVLELPNLSTAISTRAGLYRLAQKLKSGDLLDAAALHGVEFYTPKLLREHKDSTKPVKLLMSRRIGLGALESQLDALGLSEDYLRTEEEEVFFKDREEDASLLPRSSNPFYSRDE